MTRSTSMLIQSFGSFATSAVHYLLLAHILCLSCHVARSIVLLVIPDDSLGLLVCHGTWLARLLCYSCGQARSASLLVGFCGSLFSHAHLSNRLAPVYCSSTILAGWTITIVPLSCH